MRGQRVRPLPADPGPKRRGAARRSAPTPTAPSQPLSVLRCRRCRLDGGNDNAAFPAQVRDVPHLDRTPRGDRYAGRRGHWTRPRRSGLVTPAPAHTRRQVRGVPRAPSSPKHDRRARDVRAAARPVLATAEIALLHLHGWYPAHPRERPLDLPTPGAPRRPPAPLRFLPASDPRPAPHLRGQHPDRLVPVWRGCRGLDASVVDLSRTRCSGLDVLLLVRHSRVAVRRCRTPRPIRKAPSMSSLAPTLQAFFTQRLVGQR